VTPAFYNSKLFPMIQQLANWDNYPSRISACSLISALFQFFQPADQAVAQELFTALCKDDTPMVRRAGAQNLSTFIEKLKQEQVLGWLMPLWTLLINDEVDGVNVDAIEASVRLATKFDVATLSAQMLGAIKALGQKKSKGWRVRYQIVEVTSELVKYLTQAEIESEVIPLFEELLKDGDHEVRSVAVLHLARICDKLRQNTFVQRIFPLLSQLLVDPSQHVKISLADSLCRLASNLDTSCIMGQLHPVIVQLLKDEVLEVRMTLIGQLHLIVEKLSSEHAGIFLQAFSAISEEKQWRIRLCFCQFVQRVLQSAQFRFLFASYFKVFMMDHYAAIRQ